ncbi:lens fiber major intrinsic protein-like isoform X2 [Epinephelus moara]|uniref:lens fiber major intrinsic protein-like isoform X2 n=1 Tax=Epinephelus moara TaxID=300413 RepID=UPI00214ED7FD|nr:lens fiber major intrinsic protein-like isoform X2 [Epinephelus moara]
MTESGGALEHIRRCCFTCCTPHFQFWSPSCCPQDKIMTAFKGIWTQEFWRCVGAEFFAMLLFVLLSLGSTINWGAVEKDPHPPDLVLISLCFGLTIATMVQCFSHISGAHINPAVTAAMVVTRKLSLAKAVFFLLAQCTGAIVGAAILYGITPASVRGSMGITTIPYTGASMNPARTFGPAMVTWCWENHWVYWVGPTLGGTLAGALYEYLFCPDPELKRRYSEAFIKTPFTANKHRQDSVTAQEPLFTVMDVERAERKEREREREVSGDVLSSV